MMSVSGEQHAVDLANSPHKEICTKKDGKRSYDSTMTGFEAELAASEIPEGSPLDAALERGLPRWARLLEIVGGLKNPNGARAEAAKLLITNHEAVLRDVTNPNPTTQLELSRASVESAEDVNMALREVARRLLRGRPGTAELEETLNGDDPRQVVAWFTTAKFLDGRIQSTPHERPGRRPDMSPAAAAAMRAALQEIWWISFQAVKGRTRPQSFPYPGWQC